MQYDEFIQRVQEEAGLSDEEAADQITNAVLATLGEALYRTECRKLGAQLPNELRNALYSIQDPENARDEVEQMPLEEFYNRVRARSDAGGRETETQVRTVLTVLRDAVSAGELNDVLDKLPSEYRALFRQPT